MMPLARGVLTQSEKLMTLINNTPGVVSDRIIMAAGINWVGTLKSRYGLPIARVSGLGYRRASS